MTSYMKDKFTADMVYTLSWQDVARIHCASGHYRVEITWALDRYRVSVYRRIQEPEKLVRRHDAWYARTAVSTANRMLREYANLD